MDGRYKEELDDAKRRLDALRRAVLDAAVLRATCDRSDIIGSFRVHLREDEWNNIVAKARLT
jgi:hypothetical protein